jgi:xanthine dehydrogenase accessory factor
MMNKNGPFVLIRGGGDLASGVALRLHHSGIQVLITEQPAPLAVRRLVSFAEAVYRGHFTVENVTARLIHSLEEMESVFWNSEIPILIDPELKNVLASTNNPLLAIVDAKMTKKPPNLSMDAAELVIGLGPGFQVGKNCHAAVETNRGHFLGRVLWHGAPEADTGIPGVVAERQQDRVLRSPVDGIFRTKALIGERIHQGQLVAVVENQKIIAPFDGILRGLLHDQLMIRRGIKVGDIDPRNDFRYATKVSEKSLAIGGGVLEALLTLPKVRKQLWI